MPKSSKEMTQRFEMKCGEKDYAEWTAAAHRRHQNLSAFVRDAARAAAREVRIEGSNGEVCAIGEGIEREADALRTLGRVLRSFDRDTQLRILESTCTLMCHGDFARQFREVREAPALFSVSTDST